ncbi:MAG: hypothetical protein ACKVT1_02920 [Dehalococcoidia bacterium]
MSTPRVSPPRIFPEAAPAGKPPAGSAGSADAYRQTGFVLGAEVEMAVEGLNIEGAIAQGSSGAKQRTQQMASALGLWSRAWLCRLEALHAVQWGNYTAAIPLIRSAADCQAAGLWLLQTDAAEWVEWLAQGGMALAAEEHAMEYQLHAFRSAEVLAGHEILGPVYRTATDLSLPHFGTTLLLAGSDSTPERVLMTFADRDFHLGLAELVLGWLHQLAAAQVEACLAYEGVFGIPDPAGAQAFATRSRAAAATPSRCRVEVVEREGMTRYLVQNWRRAPGAAPKRVLL